MGTSPPKKPKKKVCEECGVATYALKNHILAFHSDKIFKCDECGKIYNSPYLLKGHINNVHIKVPCSMCGEMVSKGKFNYHMQQKHVPASEKKHKCDYCGKGFSETSRLRDHINVHTGEKPHKCRFCNTGFASIGNKAAHERSHLGLKRKSSGSKSRKRPPKILWLATVLTSSVQKMWQGCKLTQVKIGINSTTFIIIVFSRIEIGCLRSFQNYFHL